jgi:hypothetical protein
VQVEIDEADGFHEQLTSYDDVLAAGLRCAGYRDYGDRAWFKGGLPPRVRARNPGLMVGKRPIYKTASLGLGFFRKVILFFMEILSSRVPTRLVF